MPETNDILVFIFDFIKYLIPIILTYYTTRYTINKPIKRKVNEEQFQKVYLPLYKILCTKDLTNLSNDEYKKYYKRLNNILSKNYELAFPQLHVLSKKFFLAINNNTGINEVLQKIIYQVTLDYERLKKTLGYPHITAYQLFKRQTTSDKLKTIIIFLKVIIPYLLCLVVSFNADKVNFNNLSDSNNLIAIIVSVLLIIMAFNFEI